MIGSVAELQQKNKTKTNIHSLHSPLSNVDYINSIHRSIGFTIFTHSLNVNALEMQ